MNVLCEGWMKHVTTTFFRTNRTQDFGTTLKTWILNNDVRWKRQYSFMAVFSLMYDITYWNYVRNSTNRTLHRLKHSLPHPLVHPSWRQFNTTEPIPTINNVHQKCLHWFVQLNYSTSSFEQQCRWSSLARKRYDTVNTVSSAKFIIHCVVFKTTHFSRQPTHHVPSERVNHIQETPT